MLRTTTTAFAASLVTVLVTAGLTAATAGSAEAATTVTKPLRRAIESLSVARETQLGYARERFPHWVDADGDCRDTRDEVLAAESLTPVRGCDVGRGRWVSYYDGVTTRTSSGLDVDHLVPLAEAWASGARGWNVATRQRFANDLRDGRTLVAVTASSNRSKSDRDPAEWMPELWTCTYLRQWVAVKSRWQLNVDAPEKRALLTHARGCANGPVSFTPAVIRRSSGAAGGAAGTGPTPTGRDPRYGSCAAAVADGYGPYVRGRDPEYSWYVDGDNDGVVCE